MNKQEQARRFSDRSTKAGREFIDRGMWEAEEASKTAKQGFSSSVATMRELNITLIDMAHENADAVFDLAHNVATAQAPTDLVAIWSAYARRKFEMMTSQARELSELRQKWASRNGGLGHRL
ncbi:MAG: phasin family protein [Xanthobacteraceae bacterium]